MVDGSGGGASGSGRGRARYVILLLASLQLLLSSGLVLGWMGFILIFKGEATFSSGCSSDDRASGACLAAEDLALTKIFTAGMTTAAMAPLPLGLVIDRCASPRLVGVVFAAGTAAGFLVVAVSSNLAVVAAGFALFSFFGSGIQLNLFHVASLFPERKGLVMGLFTTLFGFSALLPMMLFYIWEWLDSPADARRTLFLWFSALLCGFVAFSATMGARFNEGDRVRWGRLGFELVPPETAAGEKKKTADGGAEGAGLGGSQAAGGHLDADEIDVAQGTTAGPEDSSRSSSSLRSLLCSSDYLVFLAFFTLHFFRSLFYLGAVDLQVASIAGSTISDERAQFVAVNGWIKPFGTLVGPPIGHIIHRRPVDGAAIVAAVVVATSALHGVAAVAGVFWLLPVAYGGATLAEESIITMLFSYVEDRFGFEHFGTLTGAVLFINGLIAMLVYPLLDAIVTAWAVEPAVAEAEGMQSQGAVVPFFVWQRISAMFLLGTALSVSYPVWLYRKAKSDEGQKVRNEP